MQASFLDLRRKMREILRALERNEPVTILYRGKKKAILMPIRDKKKKKRIQDDPAFGMWKDRKDMEDVAAYVRSLRKGRYRDL